MNRRTERTRSPGSRRKQLREWAPVIARLVLAAVLALAGLAKVRDLTAAGRTVALYRIGPPEFAPLVGGVLPFIELALAVLLVTGLASRATATATAGLRVGYVGAITSVWVRSISIDCGCFAHTASVGAGSARTYSVDILRDLILLAMAGFLIRRPGTRYALDHWVLEVKGY